MPTPLDATSCPHTLGPSVAHSPEALPVILKDRTFESIKAGAEGDLDTFVKELNEVLTFDGGVLEKGEITTTSTDLCLWTC